MSKIDSTSIQYVPKYEHQDEGTEVNPPANEIKSMDKIVKERKAFKKEIKKENEKIDEKEKDKEIIDKQRLILILRFYVLEFNDKLAEFKKTKFEKKSLEELVELRKEFDAIISSKTSLKQTQNLIMSSIKMMETIACMFTPIQCQGLSNLMLNDPDVLDDIKHIALKRMSMINVEPEYRLMYKIFSNVMLLHNANSAGIRNDKPSLKNSKINELNEKYTDL